MPCRIIDSQQGCCRVARHRPVLYWDDSIRGVRKLLKRPEGQIKVILASTTPVLCADLSSCLDWVLAGAGVTHTDRDHLGVIPALGEEDVVFQHRVTCGRGQSEHVDRRAASPSHWIMRHPGMQTALFEIQLAMTVQLVNNVAGDLHCDWYNMARTWLLVPCIRSLLCLQAAGNHRDTQQKPYQGSHAQSCPSSHRGDSTAGLKCAEAGRCCTRHQSCSAPGGGNAKEAGRPVGKYALWLAGPTIGA